MSLCSVTAELSRSVETFLTFAVCAGRGAGGDGRRAGGRDRLPARLRPRRRRICHIMIAGKKEERPGQDCTRTMVTVARVSNTSRIIILNQELNYTFSTLWKLFF